jgi:N-acetylglucosamine kinase-like BadF-type ATPase
VVAHHVDAGFVRMVDDTPTTFAQLLRDVEKSLAAGSVARSELAGIGVGLPFFGELARKDEEFVSALKAEFAAVPCVVTNDSEVAWAGSLAARPGINIVAGTGAIAFGRNAAGESARAGGWAPFFSDEGSCHWLGRHTMELFSKQADGRVERGPLYEIIREEYGIADDFAFIEIMEHDVIPHRKKVAHVQVLLEKAAIAGDPGALALYDAAVDELVLTVEAVARRLAMTGTPYTVSYSGGLFRAADSTEPGEMKSKHIIEPFRTRLAARGARLERPLLDPSHGAVLCAARVAAPELVEPMAAAMVEA